MSLQNNGEFPSRRQVHARTKKEQFHQADSSNCTVLVAAKSDGLADLLTELATLAGLTTHPLKEELEYQDRKHLVLIEEGIAVPPSLTNLPRVVVGVPNRRVPGGEVSASLGLPDVYLPGDEVTLVRVLGSWANAPIPSRAVYLVCAWHGGGGATKTALRLADLRRAVLLDAAGNSCFPSKVSPGGVVWDELVVDDLPAGSNLVASLPRVEGVPTLIPALGHPLSPDAEIVAAVAARIPRDVVIDCGTRIEEAVLLRRRIEGEGLTPRLMIVGKGGYPNGNPLVGTIKTVLNDGSDVPLVLVTGSPSDECRSILEALEVQWIRLPRLTARKAWSKIMSTV